MEFSKKSVELMLDLVEIKLSIMQVNDREDARELQSLRMCREELLQQINSADSKNSTDSKESYQKI